MKSASYEYRKMSARRGAQFVPIGMPTVCWKTFPAKTTKILSTRNSSILMMSSSEYLLLESECSKYGKSLEFASKRRVNPRFCIFEFFIMLKCTMYQFEPNPQSTIDARGSDTPLLASYILVVLLRLFYRSELIFLAKMHSCVSKRMKKQSINEQKSPKRYRCKNQIFIHMAINTLKIGVVMFQGPFCTLIELA